MWRGIIILVFYFLHKWGTYEEEEMEVIDLGAREITDSPVTSPWPGEWAGSLGVGGRGFWGEVSEEMRTSSFRRNET